MQPIEERTFEADGQSRLLLSLPRADVRLRAGKPGGLRVRLEAAGDTPAEAQQLADEARLRMHFQQGTAKVEAAAPPASVLRAWCNRPGPVFRAEVTLPPACDVDATTFGGRIEAKALEGHLVLSVQGGDLAGRSLSGRVEVRANASTVRLKDIGGKHLHVNQACGELTVHDVHTEKAKFALASVATEVADARGPVEAHVQAGRLTLGLPDEASPVRITATRAALVLQASAGLSAWLRLEGSPVALDEAATFVGKQDEQRAVGTLNGGDVPVTARSVEGAVRLALHDG